MERAGLVEVQAPAIDVVDTIGAGDSFQAGCCLPCAPSDSDQDKCAGANEFRRASSGAVIRVDVRGLHMWARRGRSARRSDVGPALANLLSDVSNDP